jgi:hypothetical protein
MNARALTGSPSITRRENMPIVLLIVVIGWGFILDQTVKSAAREVSIALAPGSGVRMFCWIPIVAVVGMAFPGIFFPGGIVFALKAHGSKTRWFSYVRLGCLGYLMLLFGLPIALAVAARG